MGPGAPVIWEEVGLPTPDFFGVAKANDLWPASSNQGFINILF